MEASTRQFALPLQGKLAIITGGSRGIGAGLALELARRGANICIVYVSDASKQSVIDLQTNIQQLPHKPTTWACQANLSSPTGAQEVITQLRSQLPSDTSLKIDILINNAAVETVNSMKDASVDEFDTVFNLNVRGSMLMTQAVIPYLPPKSRIINVSSVAARFGFKGVSLYTASKAALEGFTRAWASELGENGTTVNAVAPGPVPSDMLDNIPKSIVDMQKATTPIEQRLGTTEEIASIVAWLAGPDASWVTGQVISASGGWVMY
ncbi:3-ketoacyl-acyl carrier protein reductase [Aspergillus heteromorphus CBS 117.55]|uniref:3-ketoacyl-acyl carrier protein reductase n=1 Tax=Aspergillus heteromorphus CBS 117.55 TaxID=1448321 RepID=A0A317WXD1_9EURO|nr:3-ketoacyl-acyl carrier protein reductase [Aspergillus heteromorphus CBS 117.55]PWY90675.1 3-ketoacyl-acyl carrier protein reductase [Aspergillus heteromorphus CBS 117.55]